MIAGMAILSGNVLLSKVVFGDLLVVGVFVPVSFGEFFSTHYFCVH